MRVASDTNTRELVVALYLLPGPHQARGIALTRDWQTPAVFPARRGKWSFTQRWSTPEDLPAMFKLIRIRLDGNPDDYPKTEIDSYGWRFQYAEFIDHLAVLFAHELHHFRRYHLGFHPREGEHSANRWAIRHVHSLGFRVEGTRAYIRRSNQSILPALQKTFPGLDRFRSFRKLKAGARLRITHDPSMRYRGQAVTVVRPIRSNSKRIVITTPDGKTWRWPMDWLMPDSDDDSLD